MPACNFKAIALSSALALKALNRAAMVLGKFEMSSKDRGQPPEPQLSCVFNMCLLCMTSQPSLS